MTKPHHTEAEVLQQMVQRLIVHFEPVQVWLFGSRAEGRARPGSDYDLLVVLPDGVPEADLDLAAAWSVVRDLGAPVDVVPCTKSEFEEERWEIDSLPRAAFLRGRCLYERAA